MKLLLYFITALTLMHLADGANAHHDDATAGISNSGVVMAKTKCRKGFRYDKNRKLCISVRGSY